MVKLEFLREKRQFFELTNEKSHRNFLPGKSKIWLEKLKLFRMKLKISGDQIHDPQIFKPD